MREKRIRGEWGL